MKQIRNLSANSVFRALLLILIFGFSACDGSKEVVSENEASSPEVAKSEESTEPMVSAAGEVESYGSEQRDQAVQLLKNTEARNGLTLLEAGSGDKKVYKYNFPEESSSMAEMRVKMSSSSIINGQSVPTPPMPVIITPMEFKTVGEDQGKVKVEATYREARIEADPSVPDFLKEGTLQQMNRLIGITMSWEVDSQGELSNVTFPDDLPADLKSLFEQTQRSMSNMFVGLPTEPIGENASWVLGIDSFNIGGIEQQLKILYKLVKIEGDSLELEMTTRSDIQEQEFDLPGAGAKAKAHAAVNYNFGKMKIKLSSLIPNSQVEGVSRIVVEVGGVQKIESTTDLEMEFKEIAVEAASEKKAANS